MNVIQRFQGHRYTSKSRQWIFMCLAVLTLISGSLNPVFGQKKSSITITGVVTDAATKEPLAGATVSIKGSSKGITVDAAGKYSISAPSENAVLEARFIGYASKTVTVGTQTEINFTLAMNASDLEQVIVVGYGTQKKTDVTGSVKSVTSAAFNKGIINSPEQLLQGKVAGVNVTSATGEPGGV
jgi:iron complex outermembrane receptor protein